MKRNNIRSYKKLFCEKQPVLKTSVRDLAVGDLILIEDEFGEFHYGTVDRFSKGQRNICVSGLYFNIESGSQLKQLVDHKEVVIGSYLPDKRIHLGNGALFTEEHRIKSFTTRAYYRDRRKLVDQILKSTTSDWLDFTDEELVTIVKRLARLDGLTLDYIHAEQQSSTDNEKSGSI